MSLTLSGINVQSLTQMACDARMMDADARAATVQTIAGHMEDALEIQREVYQQRYIRNERNSRSPTSPGYVYQNDGVIM